MQLLLVALVAAPVIALAVGVVRGRVTVSTCCPDPSRDKRLAGGLQDDAAVTWR